MKKYTVLGILFCMSVTVMAGCGKDKVVISSTNQTSVSSTSTSSEIKTETSSEAPKEEPVAFEDPNEELQKAYLEFLEGNRKVKVNNEYIEWLENGKEYTYDELNQIFISFMDSYSTESKLSSTDYAFIDCGADGVQELALNQYFSIQSDEANVVSVYKMIDDQLYLESAIYGYYRSNININKYGYITYGGSDGASVYYVDYRFVNKDGEEVFLYSDSMEMDFCDAYISTYDFPGHKAPEGYPEDVYAFDDKYIITSKYNFMQYIYNPANNDEEYFKNNFFTFSDTNDQYVEPNEELAKIYKENGIVYYDLQETEKRIREHEESLGVTDTIRDGEDIDWISFFAQ